MRHQVDESDLGVKEEEAPSVAAEDMEAPVVQETKSGKSTERGSASSSRVPARATETMDKRPQKRRKKVVFSDSEQEDCIDERIFEELDEEDE